MSENDGGDRRFMRRAEAAKYVANRYGFPCSRQWLAKLAVIGGGPTFRKAGRYPIYEPGELDQWAQSRILGPRSARHPTSMRHEPLQKLPKLRHAKRIAKLPASINDGHFIRETHTRVLPTFFATPRRITSRSSGHCSVISLSTIARFNR